MLHGLYLCFSGPAFPAVLGENHNLYPGLHATSRRDKKPSFHRLSLFLQSISKSMIPVLCRYVTYGKCLCQSTHLWRVNSRLTSSFLTPTCICPRDGHYTPSTDKCWTRSCFGRFPPLWVAKGRSPHNLCWHQHCDTPA